MKAIFIDRDGVINKDPGGWTKYNYVTEWNDFHFLADALKALKKLKENGIKVVVISNQAGVNKGYFSKKKLDEINKRMLEEIEKNGGKIDEVYYCIHKNEDNCSCRKPKTGLFEKARKKYHIDFKKAFFIGDSKADITAGKRVGCKTIFVLSGKTTRKDMEGWDEKPDYIFGDLLEAVEWLVNPSMSSGFHPVLRHAQRGSGSMNSPSLEPSRALSREKHGERNRTKRSRGTKGEKK